MKKYLQEAQRDGRMKETTINKAYIESGEYRKKFDRISNDKNLNRLIYMCAKQMLYHRSGTALEDMYWIDPVSCRVVARETNQNTNGRIFIEDFNSNCKNKYGMGIVCCHNGNIFLYSSDETILPKQYNIKIQKYVKRGISEYDAQIMALEELQKQRELRFEEMLL